MTTWTQCGSHSSYPTIDLRVTTAEDVPRRPVLFDTGAGATYLADTLFPEPLRAAIEGDEAMWDLEVVRSPTRPTEGRVFTKSVEVPIEVSDGTIHSSGNARVKYVVRWEQTVFARCGLVEVCGAGRDRCETRVGLVSTGLLEDIGVEVILDGKKRSLSLRRDVPVRTERRANRG